MRWKVNRKLFTRFFLGVTTKEEDRMVFDSRESDEMLSTKWEDYTDLKEHGVFFNKEGVFQVIQYQMENQAKKGWIKQLKLLTQKYAAAFILGLIIGGTSLFFGIIKPYYINTLTLVEVNNPFGKRTCVNLPDGSKVTLNAGTQLIYPKKFSGSHRLVNLKGEAFFEVQKDERNPFMVQTPDLSVEVLGTSFNVMAYANDNTIETTLVTGKVRINRKNPITGQEQKVILTPNHKAIYYKSDGHILMDMVDVRFDTSWKQGILLFDNEPFEYIIKKLERWYNTPIELSDNLKGKHRFTMSLSDESLNDVLEMIKETTPVNYTWANGKVIFYNRK